MPCYAASWSGRDTVIEVLGGRIAGMVVGRHGTGYIDGAMVLPDGTAEVHYGGTVAASMRFSGNSFAGNFDSICGRRNVTGAHAR